MLKVEFELNGGTRNGGGELSQTVPYGEAAFAPSAVRDNYIFTGWDKDFDEVTSDLTINALWAPRALNTETSRGPGNSGFPVLPLPRQSPEPEPTPAPETIIDTTLPEGQAVPGGSAIPAEFITDHIKYVFGYPDGTLMPDANITRAETAEIIYRLLRASLDGIVYESPFTDVGAGDWYAQSVSYLADIGIIRGYEDGAFKPDNTITRAEFATMISRFSVSDEIGDNIFNDVGDDYWAVDYISNTAANGWIMGYPDGSFKPEANITRAEAIIIMNRMLNRMVAADGIPIWAAGFSDVSEDHWAYTAVIEAANGHKYERAADGGLFEIWTGRY